MKRYALLLALLLGAQTASANTDADLCTVYVTALLNGQPAMRQMTLNAWTQDGSLVTTRVAHRATLRLQCGAQFVIEVIDGTLHRFRRIEVGNRMTVAIEMTL